MARITIHGHSDDCIVVEGLPTGADEFYAGATDRSYIACSEGSVLRVAYGEADQGCWRVTRVQAGVGAWHVEFKPKDDDDEGGYSDRITLDDVDWVFSCGDDEDLARKLARVDHRAVTKARAVLTLLGGRRGFGDWWGNIGGQNQAEVLVELAGAL